MKTLRIIMPKTFVLDGFILATNYVSIVATTIGTQITLPSPVDDKTVLMGTLPTTLDAVTIDSRVSLELASEVNVRLVTPSAPSLRDLLLLFNNGQVGVYQYVAGEWSYHGVITVTPLTSSVISAPLSQGFRQNLPFYGFVCQVVVVGADETLPLQLLPFKVYAETVTGQLYFPYANAITQATPYSVGVLYVPEIVASLSTEREILVSGLGYQQTKTLPNDRNFLALTYNSIINPTIGQPVAIYDSTLALLTTAQLAVSNKAIDYRAVEGLSESQYQLSSGYYRGGNNLWDTVITDRGTAQNLLTQVMLPSVYSVSITNLEVSVTQSYQSGNTLLVYIGKPGYVTADNIIISLAIGVSVPVRLNNIRLAQGETIFLKLTKSGNYHFRYTQLCRSL